MATVTPNFAFLGQTDPALVDCAARAERLVLIDPPMALTRLRLLGEVLALHAAKGAGLFVDADEKFGDVVNRLRAQSVKPNGGDKALRE